MYVTRESRARRRSVEFDGSPWVGWDRLLSYFDECPTQRHKDVFTVLFETGGRASEVITLQPSNFTITGATIRVDNMMVLKHKRRMQRNFLINRADDLLSGRLVEIVRSCTTSFILPRHTIGGVATDKHIKRARLYQLVKEISPSLWPHWFRSQRASYFVFEKKANPYQLADWFGWKSMDTPLRYVKQSLEEQKNWLGISGES